MIRAAGGVKDEAVEQPALGPILEDETEVIQPGALKSVDGPAHGGGLHVNVGIGKEEDLACGQRGPAVQGMICLPSQPSGSSHGCQG